jgi:hypothetical protein
MKMNLPERSFLRSALMTGGRGTIRGEMEAAVARAKRMNREANKTALFNLIAGCSSTSASGLVGFTTASPKLKHWNDVPPNRAAGVLPQPGPADADAAAGAGRPAAWHLDYSAGSTSTPRARPIRPRRSTRSSMRSRPRSTRWLRHPQTLGGLVQWARIEGTIETFEGTLGDQEVALIPFRLLAPA